MPGVTLAMDDEALGDVTVAKFLNIQTRLSGRPWLIRWKDLRTAHAKQ